MGLKVASRDTFAHVLVARRSGERRLEETAMHKRWAVAAGSVVGAVALLGSAGVAFADLVITVPAPVGQATATAANVAGVVGVANTASAATPTSGAASADALKIGNTTVVGGNQIGVGTNSGKVIDTGSTPLGRLQVLPW